MIQNTTLTLVGKLPEQYQSIARQFIKFAVTGTVGAIVDFGSYNMLTRGFGWNDIYYVYGYEIIAANLVSVFLAISSNFILNKYWTFRDTSEAVVRQWTGYFVLNFFTFVLNQLLTSFFAFRVPAIYNVFGSQKDNAAKAIAIALILVVNFVGSKFIIFRKKQS